MKFISNLDTPLDFFAFFLVLSVVFVNGFTDAPSSIHSSVKSRALTLFHASLVSGAFNFLGAFLSSFFGFSVGKSVLSFADFTSGTGGSAVAIASLLTVVLVGILSWAIKLPSSESHALLFSLAGASLCARGTRSLNIKSVAFIIFGMIFSCAVAFILSKLFNSRPFKGVRVKGGYLIFSCGALSFMHGAQDGQKLLAVLLVISGVSIEGKLTPPPLPVLAVSTVMCISTVVSGKRILTSIDKLSENTDTSSGFFSDLSSFLTLVICSLIGLPVSTGNVKSASVFASEKSPTYQSKRVITRIFTASIITLPISFLLGFALCKIITFFIG